MIKIFILSIMLLASLEIRAELSCSANDLHVLYINGVNIERDDNANTVENINNVLSPVKTKIHKKNYKIKGVYNLSRGLVNDVEELKAQLSNNYNGKKKLEFWKKWARSKANRVVTSSSLNSKIDEALEQISNGKNIPLDKDGFVIDQDYYSKTDFYKDIGHFNIRLAELLANASSDTAVVYELKARIKDFYKEGGNKLIVVAHSQGNEVLRNAINDLRNDTSFIKDGDDLQRFEQLTGYLQVAPPSSVLVPGNRAHIRVDVDAVIGSSNFVTGTSPVAANYTYNSEASNNARYFNASSWVDKLLAVIGYNGGSAAFHGMDDVYLSNTFTSSYGNTSKTMANHFQDRMINLGESLASNCMLPVIKFESSEISIDNAGKIQVTGYANQGRTLEIRLKDIAVDPDDQKALARGYDHSKTKFEWKVETTYPFLNRTPQGTFVEEGEGNKVTVSLPYRDLHYLLTVKMTNEYGDGDQTVTYVKNIEIKDNKAPSIAVSDRECNSDTGTYKYDSMTAVIRVQDDQLAYDNQEFTAGLSAETATGEVDMFDGKDYSNKITLTNSCKIKLEYELMAQCQNGKPCYDYGLSEEDQRPGCNEMVKTGLQWTYLRLFDELGETQGMLLVSEGTSVQPNKTIQDPTDPEGLKTISFAVGGACSAGTAPIYDIFPL